MAPEADLKNIMAKLG